VPAGECTSFRLNRQSLVFARWAHKNQEESAMSTRFVLLAAMTVLLFVSVARAQFPIMEMVADKVIQKYQQSTCEQLWQERAQPKPPMEQDMIKTLQGDPQMRTAFLNKIAGPVVNKMFECGMIP
jgi:hypothetical protein